MMRLVVALVLIGALAAFVLRRAPAIALAPEASYRVTTGPAVLTVEATGELVSSVEQPITLNGVSGQIEEIVQEGTRVEKGAVVARLSTFQWEEQERGARQDVFKKQAEMKRTTRENSAAGAEDRRKIEEKSEELIYNRRVLAFLEGGPDPRTVDSLSLKIEKAALEDVNLGRRLTVQQALKERGYLSELDYESIKTDRIKSQLERAKQENLLAEKREGPRAEERRRSRLQVERFDLDHDLARANAESQEVLRKLALSKKEAEIRDRQAAVDEKARNRERAVVKAPISGTVIYGEHAMRGEPIGVGATAYSGMTLMKIVKRGTMHAELDVPERWLDRIQVDQKVTLRAAHRSKRYTGKVLSVARLATGVDDDPKSPRLFRVVVRLDSDDRALKPNMSCLADIEIARHADVARLPVDLMRSREKTSVELVARRGLAKVDLTATLVDEDRDFIYVRGLSPGEVLLY